MIRKLKGWNKKITKDYGSLIKILSLVGILFTGFFVIIKLYMFWFPSPTDYAYLKISQPNDFAQTTTGILTMNMSGWVDWAPLLIENVGMSETGLVKIYQKSTTENQFIVRQIQPIENISSGTTRYELLGVRHSSCTFEDQPICDPKQIKEGIYSVDLIIECDGCKDKENTYTLLIEISS